jgi:hypothetical protein
VELTGGDLDSDEDMMYLSAHSEGDGGSGSEYDDDDDDDDDSSEGGDDNRV